MPAITIVDLNNAKSDVDHIADVATSTALTATDRKGNTKKTLAGLASEVTENIGNHYAETLAALSLIVSPKPGAGGIVENDPDPAKNGWYKKTGAAGSSGWTRIANQPASAADVATVRGRVEVGTYAHTLGAETEPGQAPDLYTNNPSGNPESRIPITGDGVSFISGYSVVDGAHGKALRISNVDQGYVSPRAAQKVEAGRIYEVRALVQRIVDPSSPTTDTISIGIEWMAADFSTVLRMIGSDNNVVVANGAKWLPLFTVSSSANRGASITAPAGSVYMRPWIRTNGASHTTDLLVLDIVDVTEAREAKELQYSAPSVYPGDSPSLFTGLSSRTPAFRSGLLSGGLPAGYSIVEGARGRAVRITNINQAYLWPCNPIKVLPGRVYALRAAVERIVDPVSPADSPVATGLEMMKGDWSLVFRRLGASVPLAVANGFTRIPETTWSIDVSGTTNTFDVGTEYVYPFARTTGTDHTTDIVEVEFKDITELWHLRRDNDALAQDVSDLTQQISEFESIASLPHGAHLGRLRGKISSGGDEYTRRASITLTTLGDSIGAGMGMEELISGLSASEVVFEDKTAEEMGIDFAGLAAEYPTRSFVSANLAQAGTYGLEQSLRFLGDYPYRNPDLVFIHDWQNGRGLQTDAQFEADLRRTIELIRATTDADIILSSPVPNGVLHTSAAAYYATVRFAAVRRLAALYDCEFIDWWAEFAAYRAAHPEVSLTGDIISADNVHPTQFGRWIMRNIVYQCLSGVNGGDDTSPSILKHQGRPVVHRLGEIAALGVPSEISIPSGWSAFADPLASSGYALRSASASPLSIDFEGNRVAMRVKGRADGGVVTLSIDGQPVRDLKVFRVTTPTINPNNYMTAAGMPGASMRKPWRVDAKGDLVDESFTLTMTSDYDYTVSGSVSGALSGTGNINADSEFVLPSGGTLMLREMAWTRKTDGTAASGYRSGDVFNWSTTVVGVDSIDTAVLDSGWQLVEVCHRIPPGSHTLELTGDGDPVDVDLVVIDAP